MNDEKISISMRKYQEELLEKLNSLEETVGVGFKNLMSMSQNSLVSETKTQEPKFEIKKEKGIEDSLTPQDIFMLPDPLKISSKTMIRLKIASINEIYLITKRNKNQEMEYLNQLFKMKYLRILQTNSDAFYSIGSSHELKPLTLMKNTWHLIFLTILRLSFSEMDDLEFSINKLRTEFISLSQKKRPITYFTELLTEIQQQTQLLECEQTSYGQKWLFNRQKWNLLIP